MITWPSPTNNVILSGIPYYDHFLRLPLALGQLLATVVCQLLPLARPLVQAVAGRLLSRRNGALFKWAIEFLQPPVRPARGPVPAPGLTEAVQATLPLTTGYGLRLE